MTAFALNVESLQRIQLPIVMEHTHKLLMHEVNIIRLDRKQYIYLVALAELVLHSDVKILNN